MRLPKNSPLYASLPKSVDKTLPDWDDLQYLASSPLASSSLEAQIALDNSEIWSRATQIGFGGIVTGIGTSRIFFDAMAEAMAINVEDVTAEILEQLSGSVQNALFEMGEDNEILETTLDAGVGLAVNLASVIPIVGWVVKLLWNVGKTIAKIVKLTRDNEDPKVLYPPSRFSPSADQAVLNNVVLSSLRGTDWSSLFYPPGVGKASVSGRRFRFYDVEGGGIRILTANPHGEDGWVGFIPGTAWLHQAIEVFDSKKVSDSGNLLLPSAAQQCLWIWRNVTRTSSPSAFTIYAEHAGGLWGQYIEDLRVAINESDLSSKTKRAIFEKYDHDGKYPIFGWGDGVSWQPDGYDPVRLMATLRQRQLDLCDTLNVAYVSEDFGAFNDLAVRDKFRQRRKDLLEHPAVCDVDLDSVRDVVYRGALEYQRSKIHCDVLGGNGMILSGSGSPPPEIVDGFATPEAEPPPRYKADQIHIAWFYGLAIASTLGLGWTYREQLKRLFTAARRRKNPKKKALRPR